MKIVWQLQDNGSWYLNDTCQAWAWKYMWDWVNWRNLRLCKQPELPPFFENEEE